LNYDSEYWDFKSIRDPLYGFIHLSKRETSLIGSPYLIRLTRIKQLAHSYLVYPSAVHTRFEHSLGILHIADRMCSSFKINDRRREVIRIAALLHDTGHGPFSHLFEEIMMEINGKEFSHEDITLAIIKYDEYIKSILKGKYDSNVLNNIYNEVKNIFDKKNIDEVAKAIISSQLDADKLDYLRRDSYHTGSTYGIFDLERILSTLRLHLEKNGKEYPYILEKGLQTLENFKLARYSIHSQVIQHHTRTIADQMFLRSLELAVFSEKIVSKDYFKFKNREKEFIKEFLNYDDHSIYDIVLDLQGHKENYSFQIMNDLKNRKLFKRCYIAELKDMPVNIRMEIEKGRDLKEYEKLISEKTRVPKELVIVYLESEEPGFKSYKSFSESTKSDELPFLYMDKDGKLRPSDEKSSLIVKKDFNKRLFVFSKDKYRSRVEKTCHEIFK